MKFAIFKVSLSAAFLLVFASSGSGKEISEQLDNVFFNPNLSLDDSRIILDHARNSYKMLKDYGMVKDNETREELGTRLKIFTRKTIQDLTEEGMTLLRLFENIEFNLKGDGNATDNATIDFASLMSTVQPVLAAMHQKLAQNYLVPQWMRYNVEDILSGNVRDVENFFRASTATTIGYFFLESFATILGLTWGIVSMIMSDFNE